MGLFENFDKRDCPNCIYHLSGSCSKWECDMTTVEDLKKNVWNEAVKKFSGLAGSIVSDKGPIGLCELSSVADSILID